MNQLAEALAEALHTGGQQLRALESGDSDAFLEGIEAHMQACSELTKLAEANPGAAAAAAIRQVLGINAKIILGARGATREIATELDALRSGGHVVAAYGRPPSIESMRERSA